MKRNAIIIVSIVALFIIQFLYLSVKADSLEINYLRKRVDILDSVSTVNYTKQKELIKALRKNSLDARHHIEEYTGRVSVTKDSINILEKEIIKSDERINELIKDL